MNQEDEDQAADDELEPDETESEEPTEPAPDADLDAEEDSTSESSVETRSHDADEEPIGPSKVHPDEVDETRICSILESLIFVAAEPVSAVRLARSSRTKVAVVRRLLERIASDYEARGMRLHEVAGGYQFRSAPENADYVRDFASQRPVRLTRAQLETLAIIGYRQPVTRPEVEEIRGVDSGSALKVLLERELVKIIGRKEEPGRPLMYGTTPFFLEFFGLKALGDLPTLREFSELTEESRVLFERRMGEPLELGEIPEGDAATLPVYDEAADEDLDGSTDRTADAEPASEDEEARASHEAPDEDEPLADDEASIDDEELARDRFDDLEPDSPES
jgi:segregation and condensation protein B